MPGAIAVQTLPREGQDHPRRHDPIGLHQHGPVMEGGIGSKQIEQQIHGELGIQGNPRIEKILRPQVTAQVHHDQAPAAGLGEATSRFTEHRHRARGQLVALAVAEENPKPARTQQLHQPAQFPLPENCQRQTAGQDEGVHQLGGERQVGVALHKPGQGHEQQIAAQQPEGARLGHPTEHQYSQTGGKQQVEQQSNVDELQGVDLQRAHRCTHAFRSTYRCEPGGQNVVAQ